MFGKYRDVVEVIDELSVECVSCGILNEVYFIEVNDVFVFVLDFVF